MSGMKEVATAEAEMLATCKRSRMQRPRIWRAMNLP